MSETYTKVVENDSGISFYKGKYLVKFFDAKHEQTIYYDRKGNLHKEYGAAIVGKDGYRKYYIHGVPIAERDFQSRLEQLEKIRAVRLEVIKVYYFCVFCIVVGAIAGFSQVLAVIFPIIACPLLITIAFQLDKDYEREIFRKTNGH